MTHLIRSGKLQFDRWSIWQFGWGSSGPFWLQFTFGVGGVWRHADAVASACRGRRQVGVKHARWRREERCQGRAAGGVPRTREGRSGPTAQTAVVSGQCAGTDGAVPRVCESLLQFWTVPARPGFCPLWAYATLRLRANAAVIGAARSAASKFPTHFSAGRGVL